MKLICFDLDDTLIRDIHSVMLPCMLNGKEEEHAIIQQQEEEGRLDYRSADYLRAQLLTGLNEDKISECFLDIAKPLKNIAQTISELHAHDIKCLLITVGPIQVAKVAAEMWGFDSYYGSHYEVVEGKFTGRIDAYIKAENKVDCLQDFCLKNNVSLEECMAVGDGATDIPVFEKCGKYIALNSSDKVKRKATYAANTDDLCDIVKFIL